RPGVGDYSINIPEELSQSLKRVARQTGVPVKSVLLAAHLRVLGLLSGTYDVVTGLVTNGRPETAGGHQVLGLFLNTVPFRLHLQAEPWPELIRRVFEAEQGLLPHRRFPLAEIKKLCDRRELYDVGSNFVHFHVYSGLLNSGQIEVLGSKGFEKT